MGPSSVWPPQLPLGPIRITSYNVCYTKLLRYHVHDIHFPYNTPVPADEYIFGAKWPLFRTEAMILQALLSDNPTFETVLSAPMIRHFDEPFLERTIPGYRRVETKDYDTHFGSYWGRRLSAP